MHPICVTCGTQFAEAAEPPKHCPICEDARQYVGLRGQLWTTLEQLRREHRTKMQQEESALLSFSVEPHFGIGQRAFLVQTPAGNVLWDCISLVDDAAVERIRQAGGVTAIAISHPHYYTAMAEWSRAFGGVPIYLHQDDAHWVMRPDPALVFWGGETRALSGGLTLIRCGGHFPGGTVLHFPAGGDGQGALLSGDIIQVVSDRRFVSFMYSYPNYIPLDAAAVRRIAAAVEPFAFDRIYGAFPAMTVARDAKGAIERSVERYLRAIAARPMGALPTAPARKFAVVTCMDPRLDVQAILGLNPMETNVLRNAGGIVTEDVLRSLIISHHLLGTRQIFIINHTDCGMLTFHDRELAERLEKETGASPETPSVFHSFTDLDENVRAQIRAIRAHPWIPQSTPIRGFVYDVVTGKAREVSESAVRRSAG